MHQQITVGEDYAPVDESVQFAPGFGQIQCVKIPILNDNFLEEDLETFSVAVSSQQSCVVIGRNETEVNIRDDDGMKHFTAKHSYVTK